MEQSKNIRLYAAYLEERVAIYRETKMDYLKPTGAVSSLRSDKWNEGLESCLNRAVGLLKTISDCKFFLDSLNNEITLEVMRLLVLDLLGAYQLVGEGAANMLSTYQLLVV